MIENVTNNANNENSKEIELAKKQEKNNKNNSFNSLVCALIPIILYVYCYIKSRGDGSEAGAGAIWWLMVLYYWTLGIPLFIASLVFGFSALKKNKLKTYKVIALLGIIIDLFPLLYISAFYTLNSLN